MIYFWRLGLKRAPGIWILSGLLYLIAFIETAIFIRYEKYLVLNQPLLYYAFVLLSSGFICGILMVQAILCRSLRYEIGNFETLGFTRSNIIAYYSVQNIFVLLAALLPAIPIDLILNALFAQKNIPTASVDKVILGQFFVWAVLSFMFFFFTIVFSRQAPAMLLREKG